MNPEVQKPPVKKNSINLLILSLAIFSLLMLVIAGQLTYTILNYDRMYNGIYINNIHVGKLSLSEANSLLSENFKNNLESIEITLKAGGETTTFDLGELDAGYNFDEAINRAYGIGRSGSIFERLYNVFAAGKKGKNIYVSISYDREKLKNIIEDMYKRVFVNVKEADLLIENDKVTIRSGHSGKSFDKTQVLSQIESLIQTEKGGTIEIPITVTPPNKIDIDEFYKQVNKEPENAYIKVKDNKVEVFPHVMGRSIEKSTLIAIANELEKTEDTKKVLPVKFVEPEITTQKLNEMLFRDTLGTMSTYFDTSNQNNKNRGDNIRLAASKIDGKILAPGEVFSFNEIVGPRTAEGGYKEAHVYVAGEVVDGIGGGICQVSTTLYNAVLLADLEVVERKNHMFTVGYVPLGRDATVSYGGIDFKFKNSTKWPIKIETRVSKNNRITFTIKGTNENPSRKVQLISKHIKTLDYTTEYIDDPTLPEGTTKVKQAGKKGHIVETYKLIKEDGRVIEKVKLHTSVYKPLTEQILKGTKKVEPEQGPEQEPQESESNQESPQNDPEEDEETQDTASDEQIDL